MLKIALIIGSTRTVRFADKATAWLENIVSQHGGAEFEVVDLRDYPLPFFDEVSSNLYAPNKNEIALRWQKKLTEFDGYVIITAEYNHGPPAVLKNALDYAYNEWNKKPLAFVGYGGVGAALAIEQLRLIAIQLQMVSTKFSVNIQGADFLAASRQGKALEDMTHLQPSVKGMLDELIWWATALKTARANSNFA